MSLQVWLPLNGDLRNLGSANVSITNNGATVDNNGKTGKCYSFNGVDNKIQISNAPQPQDISVAMWFKRNATTNTRQFLYTQWGGITLELTEGNYIQCSVNTQNGQIGACRSSVATTVDSGWTHVCFIFKNGVGTTLYVNGEFITSATVPVSIQWTTTTGNIGYYSTYYNGKVNDFRIYDEVISPELIKHLSRQPYSGKLRTWIPGNIDFRDQGIINTQWINDGVTVVDNGKLGKCLSFNGSTSRLSTTNYTLPNRWSFACWVKEDATVSSWQMVLGLNNNGSDSDLQMGLWLKSNENRLEFSYNGSYNSGITYVPGQWNHFVGTYDGSSAKFYINGVLKSTNSNTGNLPRTNLTIGTRNTSTNGGHVSITNSFKGFINDIRIYDVPLTADQVKKLAQGLVLHYPLDNNGFGGENIIPNSVEMALGTSSAAIGRWREAGSNSMTKSRVAIDDSPIGPCYCFQNAGIQTPNDGSCYGIDSFQFVASTQYTISMWSRIVSGTEGYAGFAIQNLSSEDGGSHNGVIQKNYRITTLPSDGSWIRCWYTFTTNTSTSRNIYIGIVTGDTNVTTQMCGVKIEKGAKATPWCPHKNDEVATTMGMNDGIEYDISGFGNNGTRVGELSWSGNTPRYFSSTIFEDDCNQYIHTPYLSFLTNNITMSCWTYQTSASNTEGTMQYIMSQGRDTNYNGFSIRSSNGIVLLSLNTGTGTNLGTSTNILNGWHHIVATYNGSIACIYIDGQLKNSANITGDIDYSMAYERFVVGKMSYGYSLTTHYFPFVGNISDVRIYATALSAEDVQQLYQLGVV